MNELLGWYGYDKVNTGEAKGINLSLSRFSSSSSPPQEGSESEDGSRDTTESRMLAPDSSGDSAAAQLNTGGAGGVIIECSWCSKTGLKLFTLKTSGREPKAFCSELCFNQCRRATFKKSRICDWCKHVRHTVNYVDFQDGAHQLQFCGDKCLNQYKMHIFCKETQAYLQMHPHLQEVSRSGSDHTGAGSKLITPDLWLRDCKDGANGTGGYNASVHSDDETEPDGAGGIGSATEQDESPSFAAHRTPNFTEPQTSSKPCDTTNAPAFNTWEKMENSRKEFSKTLKSKDASRRNGRQSSRNNESLLSRRPLSMSPKASSQAIARSPLSPVNHSVQMNGSPHHTLSTRTSPNVPQPPRIVPSSSPSLPPQPHSHTSSTSSGSSIPPGIPPPPPLINSELLRPPFPPHFYHPSFNYLSQQQQLEYFLRAQGSGLGMRLGMTPPPPPPAHFPHTAFSSPFLQPPSPMPIASHSFGSNSLIPPPTIMIPYPLIIPLPLPIPIPIPIPLVGTAKKATTNDTTDHPEGQSTDSLDPSVTETQDVSVTETDGSPRDPSSSLCNKTEENILIDVDVKDAQATDSVVHSPPIHVEEHSKAQVPVRTDESRQTDQPMALTRSKSRNSRGFVSPRESKRPRLTDKN